MEEWNTKIHVMWTSNIFKSRKKKKANFPGGSVITRLEVKSMVGMEIDPDTSSINTCSDSHIMTNNLSQDYNTTTNTLNLFNDTQQGDRLYWMQHTRRSLALQKSSQFTNATRAAPRRDASSSLLHTCYIFHLRMSPELRLRCFICCSCCREQHDWSPAYVVFSYRCAESQCTPGVTKHNRGLSNRCLS